MVVSIAAGYSLMPGLKDRLIVIMSARSAAHIIASTTDEAELPTLTGMILAFGAMPEMPCALSETAPMRPAHIVPWPAWSWGGVPGAPAFQPGTRRPWRSGCLRSTPVSTTATITSLFTRPEPHACGMPIRSRYH